MTRVVVGEDSVLFREGLVRLLADAGHDVLAAVGDADSMGPPYETSIRTC